MTDDAELPAQRLQWLADSCDVTGLDHLPVVSRENAKPFADDVRAVLRERADLSRRLAEAEGALRWYAEQVAGCRKITSEGNAARAALDRDGGKRARAALNPETDEALRARSMASEILRAALANPFQGWRQAAVSGPGHTDLMVTPESLDAYMAENPLPPPLFYTKGLAVWKRSLSRKTETSHSISLSFLVCTATEIVGEAGAEIIATALCNIEHVPEGSEVLP
jgi:hypothetical protein